MFESVLAASPNILGPVFGGDQAPERLKERTHGGNAMLNVYETADKRHIALGGGEHKFVEALFEGLGRPEFVAQVTGPAGEGHWPAISFLRETFRTRTREEWEAWFEGRDICWSPVVTLDEAWQADHVQERGMRFYDARGMTISARRSNSPRNRPKSIHNCHKLALIPLKLLHELDLTETDREAILEAYVSNVRTTGVTQRVCG